MRRLTSTLIASTLVLTLTACASVPSDDQLFSGIDKTQIAQAPVAQRLETDPVCVDFYKNVTRYQQTAKPASGGQNFLTYLGLSVGAAVLTQELIGSSIRDRTARVAAFTAASVGTAFGTRAVIRDLNSSKRGDAKIIDTAAEIGCPI